jgi:Fungal Zn(2)-Cys(6) binuclear cluster domain
MPRPKVRPENRQRSGHACQACKAAKIKCDSRQPCRSCVKRSQAESCTFSGTDRRRRGHGIPPEELQLHDTAMSPEATAIPLGTPLSELSGTPATRSDTSQSQSTGPCQPGMYHHIISSPTKLTRNIVCVKEEASSLLFLQFLRRTLKAYVGSVPFTDEELHHNIIEHGSCPATADIQQVPPEKLDSLLDSYFEAVSNA